MLADLNYCDDSKVMMVILYFVEDSVQLLQKKNKTDKHLTLKFNKKFASEVFYPGQLLNWRIFQTYWW